MNRLQPIGPAAARVTQLLQQEPTGPHSGLLFDRWLPIWDGEPGSWSVAELQQPLKALADDFNRRGQDRINRDLLRDHHQRLARATDDPSTLRQDLGVLWRFTSGLGAAHPTGNGFSFDPSIGAPCIPGSAIKGLCRRGAELVDADPGQIRDLLGPDAGEDLSAGDLVFYDALPTHWPTLAVDIVNCHHPSYYDRLGTPGRPPIPTETESPSPVFFLVVEAGSSFRFVIGSRNRRKQASQQGLDWLRAGMDTLGIGAKTAVGYGALGVTEPPPAPTKTETWRDVNLRYNRGSGELRADYRGQRAFVTGEDARRLVATLSNAQQRHLRQGRLQAKVHVARIGGKNWRMLDISV